jgi:hypothetical protein
LDHYGSDRGDARMSYNIESENSQIRDVAFPSSPPLNEDTVKEISTIECEILGPGVVVFRNAFQIDQDAVLTHIDSNAEEAHKTRWEYVEVDGVKMGINEDGFRYRMEDVPAAPIRLLDPVNESTPKEVEEFLYTLEDQIYKCLIKYIDHYPLMLGSIWWKTRGHILRYGDGGRLGCHADNDTNYKVTKGVRYMPKGMVASRQTCGALIYLNDCVDSEEELNGRNFTGGHLRFVHLGISYKPRKGDIIFFPTNYVASHDVETMGKGVRYSYLTFFGQGANDKSANIMIVEPDESFQWCPPVWLNNIYDDYEMYCKSPYSIFSDPGKNNVEVGWNPVYQGREVAQYSASHDAVEVEEAKADTVSEDLPEGPCGTEAVRI